MIKEIKAHLVKPYTEKERIDFIVENNHNKGYTIEELENGSLQAFEMVKTDEEKTQEEKERIAMLKMTPRDFLLAVVDMGVDYSKIKELMSSNPRVEIELQYCNNVYRGNPLLDQLCEGFGVTTEQLDELFKAKGS